MCTIVIYGNSDTVINIDVPNQADPRLLTLLKQLNESGVRKLYN